MRQGPRLQSGTPRCPWPPIGNPFHSSPSLEEPFQGPSYLASSSVTSHSPWVVPRLEMRKLGTEKSLPHPTPGQAVWPALAGEHFGAVGCVPLGRLLHLSVLSPTHDLKRENK